MPIPICIECRQPICDVCKVCETNSCPNHLLKVVDYTTGILSGTRQARSQKVRGLIALRGLRYVATPDPLSVIGEERDIEGIWVGGEMANSFVRPCPLRPRHGFVESRKLVGTPEERLEQVLQVFREAQEADPGAELMISPYYDAIMSAVVTPNRVTVGHGHDGATAGHNSVVLPVVNTPFREIRADLYEKAGVNIETEDPYIEVVGLEPLLKMYSPHTQTSTPKESLIYTQLRAGPKLGDSIGADFIPEPITVTQVIRAEGDLLQWESVCQDWKGGGTVVDHTGGSLTSHYGVHCVFNRIPVMTSRVPFLGEALVPTQKVDQPDPKAVVMGLIVGGFGIKLIHTRNDDSGYEVPLPAPFPDLSTSNAAAFVATILHNAPAMGGEAGFYLGVAAALMMRLGMSASHGEARYAAKDHAHLWQHRGFVYSQALNDLLGSRSVLGIAQHRFLFDRWQSNIGGWKWAECTESIFQLDAAIRRVLVTNTPAAVNDVVITLNRAVQKAHNGGWWLNKFVNQDALNGANEHSIHSIVSASYVALVAHAVEKSHALQWIQQALAWREAGDIQVRQTFGGPLTNPHLVAYTTREMLENSDGGPPCEDEEEEESEPDYEPEDDPFAEPEETE